MERVQLTAPVLSQPQRMSRRTTKGVRYKSQQQRTKAGFEYGAAIRKVERRSPVVRSSFRSRATSRSRTYPKPYWIADRSLEVGFPGHKRVRITLARDRLLLRRCGLRVSSGNERTVPRLLGSSACAALSIPFRSARHRAPVAFDNKTPHTEGLRGEVASHGSLGGTAGILHAMSQTTRPMLRLQSYSAYEKREFLINFATLWKLRIVIPTRSYRVASR